MISPHLKNRMICPGFLTEAGGRQDRQAIRNNIGKQAILSTF
jgi:hypothetical protein